MKFLKDERIEAEDGEVKLTIRPVTTSHQAALADFGTSSGGVTALIGAAVYALKHCVEKVSINGTVTPPLQLAEHADLSDQDTRAVMFKIGSMVDKAAFPSHYDVKKSAQPPEPGA